MAARWMLVGRMKRVTEEDVTYKLGFVLRKEISLCAARLVSILELIFCKHVEIGLAA